MDLDLPKTNTQSNVIGIAFFVLMYISGALPYIIDPNNRTLYLTRDILILSGVVFYLINPKRYPNSLIWIIILLGSVFTAYILMLSDPKYPTIQFLQHFSRNLFYYSALVVVVAIATGLRAKYVILSILPLDFISGLLQTSGLLTLYKNERFIGLFLNPTISAFLNVTLLIYLLCDRSLRSEIRCLLGAAAVGFLFCTYSLPLIVFGLIIYTVLLYRTKPIFIIAIIGPLILTPQLIERYEFVAFSKNSRSITARLNAYYDTYKYIVADRDLEIPTKVANVEAPIPNSSVKPLINGVAPIPTQIIASLDNNSTSTNIPPEEIAITKLDKPYVQSVKDDLQPAEPQNKSEDQLGDRIQISNHESYNKISTGNLDNDKASQNLTTGDKTNKQTNKLSTTPNRADQLKVNALTKNVEPTNLNKVEGTAMTDDTGYISRFNIRGIRLDTAPVPFSKEAIDGSKNIVPYDSSYIFVLRLLGPYMFFVFVLYKFYLVNFSFGLYKSVRSPESKVLLIVMSMNIMLSAVYNFDFAFSYNIFTFALMGTVWNQYKIHCTNLRCLKNNA